MPINVKAVNVKVKDKQGYVYDMNAFVTNVTKTATRSSNKDNSNTENDENENSGGE